MKNVTFFDFDEDVQARFVEAAGGNRELAEQSVTAANRVVSNMGGTTVREDDVLTEIEFYRAKQEALTQG